jgi:hypothetical protein
MDVMDRFKSKDKWVEGGPISSHKFFNEFNMSFSDWGPAPIDIMNSLNKISKSEFAIF